MKKLLFLLLFASGLTANAQSDPSFTAQMIQIVNTAKDYALARNTGDSTAKAAIAFAAVNALRPITNAQLESKVQAMKDSPTEMAKFAGPVEFVYCISHAAVWYIACMNGTSQSSPGNPWCNAGYQIAIASCAIAHLTD